MMRKMRSNCCWVLVTLLFGVSLVAQSGPPPASSDLDRFMANVLTRRDENWKKLRQYVLDEREQVTLRGLGNVPIWGEVREFTWYLRDGFFVRSPVKVNGAAVPEPDRRKYEEDYFRRVQARDQRAGRGETLATATGPGCDDGSERERATRPSPHRAGAAGAPTERSGEALSETACRGSGGEAPGSSDDVQAFILQTRQPQFIDSAYFLKFRFEPSHYALVGRETFEGREVLRIEYYPTRLFRHEQDQQQRRREQHEANAEKDRAAAIERMMNRVSLVTIWVEPKAHQIVKYTFDNVNLEFLPAAWLVHMDDAKAVMTMAEPFPDVWLPRDVDMAVAATLAVGSFDIRYHLDYSNYRKAETSSRFKIKGP